MKLRLIAIALALTATPLTALSDNSRVNAVPGEKLDSGLGGLPHYSQWERLGKLKPAHRAQVRIASVPGESLDGGLGELPHYRYWNDPSGRNVNAGSGHAAPARVADARVSR